MRLVARLVLIAGLAGVAYGSWLACRPAGFVVGGALTALYALLAIDVDGRPAGGEPPA
jgi:hypothetical protein